MTDTKKYVMGDLEVKLTGRSAVRKSTIGRNKGAVISPLFEVTPADIEDGSWKKWVKLSELYEIIEVILDNG